MLVDDHLVAFMDNDELQKYASGSSPVLHDSSDFSDSTPPPQTPHEKRHFDQAYDSGWELIMSTPELQKDETCRVRSGAESLRGGVKSFRSGAESLSKRKREEAGDDLILKGFSRIRGDTSPLLPESDSFLPLIPIDQLDLPMDSKDIDQEADGLDLILETAFISTSLSPRAPSLQKSRCAPFETVQRNRHIIPIQRFSDTFRSPGEHEPFLKPKSDSNISLPPTLPSSFSPCPCDAFYGKNSPSQNVNATEIDIICDTPCHGGYSDHARRRYSSLSPTPSLMYDFSQNSLQSSQSIAFLLTPPSMPNSLELGSLPSSPTSHMSLYNSLDGMTDLPGETSCKLASPLQSESFHPTSLAKRRPSQLQHVSSDGGPIIALRRFLTARGLDTSLKGFSMFLHCPKKKVQGGGKAKRRRKAIVEEWHRVLTTSGYIGELKPAEAS